MHDPVAMEAIAARVGHKALHGPGLLLGLPAEQVASREQSAASSRDHYGEAAVGGVEQEARAEEQARALVVEQWRTRNALLAAELAAGRGVFVSMRDVLDEVPDRLAAQVGRTRGEALSYFSALADQQDAEERARLRRALRREGVPGMVAEAMVDGDDLGGEGLAADVSAPLPEDLERDRELLERGRARRARRQEIGQVVRGTLRAREMRRGY
jgi:hypothetical protein